MVLRYSYSGIPKVNVTAVTEPMNVNNCSLLFGLCVDRICISRRWWFKWYSVVWYWVAPIIKNKMENKAEVLEKSTEGQPGAGKNGGVSGNKMGKKAEVMEKMSEWKPGTAKKGGMSGKIKKEEAVVYLNVLSEGMSGAIRVMVCRKWDVNNVSGRYISTDFVFSDEKGNVIHCTTKANIAHRFIDKLKEGNVYMIKDFLVHQYKGEYRIIQNGDYMLELHGDTGIRKATGAFSGFSRYPFELVDFEALKPSEKTRLSDVIGCVTSIGQPSITSKGAQTLDFSLTNARGKQLRVTLWGKLGEELLRRNTGNDGQYCVILTAMLSKIYSEQICVSSSSATLIFDDEQIPAIVDLKQHISGLDIAECNTPVRPPPAKWGTVAQILSWGRTHYKERNVTFKCKLEITQVRTKNGWYNLTCSSGKCRKGCERIDGKFQCPGCKIDVEYPRVRFRLQLDVRDSTGEFVAVCFDETAQRLANATAQELLDHHSEDAFDDSILPKCLSSLIGSTQIFEIRSSTYYQYGDYESFNCNKVMSLDNPDNEAELLLQDKEAGCSASIPPIPTPAKGVEKMAKRRIVYDDSEADDPAAETALADPSKDLKKKKKL